MKNSRVVAFFREKKWARNAERNKEKSETVRERERKCERGIEKAREREGRAKYLNCKVTIMSVATKR